MKIIIGSDKSGFILKEHIKSVLSDKYNLIEIGTVDPDTPVPFFKAAPIAAEMISKSEADKAILICGTGMGMAQVANKYKGVRAACVESVYAAKMCRAINDSNILCLGGWIVADIMSEQIVSAFLETEFTEGLEEWRQEFLQNAKKEFAALEDEIYK
jgi:ribose 5-phosphate isomerase B